MYSVNIFISMHVGVINFMLSRYIATLKASVGMYGMYSGYDTLSLQILFVYFLALSSLLHPSINFYSIIFYTCPFFINVIAYCPVLV